MYSDIQERGAQARGFEPLTLWLSSRNRNAVSGGCRVQDVHLVSPGATSRIQEQNGSLSGGRVDLGELVCALLFPSEQTDDGVLVYINIGRRLANLHMNHS